jgi:methionyl-tRNA synthetase
MTIDELNAVELHIGTVEEVTRVEGSDKLLKLILDTGGTKRQILSGIGKAYAPEDLIGKQVVFVANLDPRTMMGLESQGMVLAAQDAEGKPVVITPLTPVPPGSRLR